MHVEITNDYIGVYKTKGKNTTEIVYWTKEEWIEDPEMVVPAIANAIKMAYTQPKQLVELLKLTK